MQATKRSDAPILLIKSGGACAISEWKMHFSHFLAHFEIREWEEKDFDAARVKYALVWEPEDGWIQKYPNLKAVLSSSAGVDHILKDRGFPSHLPIIRMVPQETEQRMAEFVGMSCLLLQKQYPRIVDQQRHRAWKEVTAPRLASETMVGIMGLGVLGSSAAKYLQKIGFRVSGWARTPKQIDGITTYAGQGALAQFLSHVDLLVCLLPATESTRAIIDARLLHGLPRGASVVNVGRGAHLVEADLLAALASGHISYAALDVLEQEPPLPSSPFWDHPQVLLTPHSAATPSRREKARQASLSIEGLERGEHVAHLYEAARGY